MEGHGAGTAGGCVWTQCPRDPRLAWFCAWGWGLGRPLALAFTSPMPLEEAGPAILRGRGPGARGLEGHGGRAQTLLLLGLAPCDR